MMSSKGKPTPKKAMSKLKDRSKSSSSKVKSEVPEASKDPALTYPLIKISDNKRMLPCYLDILRRSEEKGVRMDDLDTLQLELESLLSAVALRTRAFNEEIQALSSAEGKQDKKTKLSPLVLGKRMKSQEKIVKKFKDTGGKVVSDSFLASSSKKSLKRKTVPSGVQSTEMEEIETEIAEPIPPEDPKFKNDTPDKFWALVEPYCADVTLEDVKLLESLIEENTIDPEYYEIPPLGCHYTLQWGDETFEDKPMKNDFPNKNLEKTADVVTGPLTQRLFSALLEENFVPVDVLCKGDENRIPQMFKSFTVSNSTSFERQIRKELEEQGILDSEEIMNDESDEILQELKQCQEELKHISAENVQHLKKLLKVATTELSRQDLKQKLMKADNDVMKLYQKLLASHEEGEVFTEEDQEMCWKTLKERDALLKLLDSL